MGFDPKVYLENDLSDVVHVFWKREFFLSFKSPKHTSKNIYVMCVHVSVLVSVYIIRVHCPLHHALVYILWSCKNLKA
jgi:hypothetical protein